MPVSCEIHFMFFSFASHTRIRIRQSRLTITKKKSKSTHPPLPDIASLGRSRLPFRLSVRTFARKSVVGVSGP